MSGFLQTQSCVCISNFHLEYPIRASLLCGIPATACCHRSVRRRSSVRRRFGRSPPGSPWSRLVRCRVAARRRSLSARRLRGATLRPRAAVSALPPARKVAVPPSSPTGRRVKSRSAEQPAFLNRPGTPIRSIRMHLARARRKERVVPRCPVRADRGCRRGRVAFLWRRRRRPPGLTVRIGVCRSWAAAANSSARDSLRCWQP